MPTPCLRTPEGRKGACGSVAVAGVASVVPLSPLSDPSGSITVRISGESLLELDYQSEIH